MVKKFVSLLFVGAVLVPSLVFAFRTTLTHTTVSVSNSASTAVLAANSRRNYLFLQNVGGNAISCKFGATAVASQGIVIAATTGSHTFDGGAVPNAALNCIAATAATNLNVTEGVQP